MPRRAVCGRNGAWSPSFLVRSLGRRTPPRQVRRLTPRRAPRTNGSSGRRARAPCRTARSSRVRWRGGGRTPSRTAPRPQGGDRGSDKRKRGAGSGQGFHRVLGFQVVVIRIGEFAGRAVELDLLQGAQRDGAGTEVVVRVLPLSPVFRFPIPVPLHLGSKDRSQHEVDRPCGEQDPGGQLEHAGQTDSRSSSPRRRSSSSGVPPALGGVAGAGAGAAVRVQRRSTSVRTTPAATMSEEGTK